MQETFVLVEPENIAGFVRIPLAAITPRKQQ
jgi:hypothetical protein